MTWIRKKRRLTALALAAALLLTGVWNGNLFLVEEAYAEGETEEKEFTGIQIDNSNQKFEGDNITANVKVAAGECIVDCGSLTVKAGYEIAGWYIDADYNTELTADNMADSITKIYPKWKLASELYSLKGAVKSQNSTESNTYYYKDITQVQIEKKEPAIDTKDSISLTAGDNSFILIDSDRIESDKITITLTEDGQGPEIAENDWKITDENGNEYDGSSYTNSELTATFSVKDSAGIAADSIKVTLENNAVNVTNNQNGTYSVTIPAYTGDSEGSIPYAYKISARDSLGNETTKEKKINIYRDKKKPTINVTASSDISDSNKYVKSTTLSVQAEDNGIGLADSEPIKYSLYTLNEDGTRAEMIENNKGIANKGTIPLTADKGQTRIYSVDISACDKSGNTSNKQMIVKIDEKGPVLVISENDTYNDSKWHNKDNSKITVTASDKESGVKEDSILVSLADGTQISKTEAKEDNVLFDLKPSASSNRLQYIVSAEDNLGNKTIQENNFMKVDIDLPEIKSVAAYNDSQNLEENNKCNLDQAVNKIKYFVAEVNDATSGIAKVKYSFSAGASDIENLPEADLKYGFSVNTTELTLDADGKAVISIWAIDNAGNISAEFKQTIIVDNTPPEFAVKVFSDLGTGTLTEITDLDNIYLNNLVLDIQSAEANVSYYLTESSEFSEQGITLTNNQYTVPNLKDGENTFYIWAKDLLGNCNSGKKILVKIDCTKPKITKYSVLVDRDGNRVSLNKSDENYYINNNFYLSAEVSDIGSGVKSLKYYIDNNLTDKYDMNLSGDTEIKIGADGLKLSEGKHIFYIEAIDVTGNVSETEQVPIYIDMQAPTIQVTGYIDNVEITDGQWINKDVSYEVVPFDNESQIDKVYYKEISKESPAEKTIEKSGDGKYKITILADSLTTGTTYSYEFWTEDKAGNKSDIVTKTFSYDKIQPEVSVKIKVKDSSKVENGQTLKEGGSFHIDFDSNPLFLKNSPSFELTFSDGNSGIESVMRYECSEEEAKELTNAAKLKEVNNWETIAIENNANTVTTNVEWKIPIKQAVFFKITDKAGNITYATSGGIVFDSEAPEITIGDYADKNKWAQGEGTVQVTLQDYSGIDTAKIRYAYFTDVQPSYDESIQYDAKGMENNTITIPLICQDQPYKLVVYAEDKAGNRGEAVTKDYQIMRDKVAPIVEFGYVFKNKWTKEEENLKLELSDNASGIKTVEYQFSYEENKEKWHTANFKEIDNVIPNGSYEIELPFHNTAYTVQVKITDRAGNEKTYTTDFEIKKDKTPVTITKLQLEGFDIQPSALELLPIRFGEKINQTDNIMLNAGFKDEASGITKVEVLRVDDKETEKLQQKKTSEEIISEIEGSKQWEAVFESAEAEKKQAEISYELINDKKARKYIAYLRITDAAGNITYANSNGVIYDRTPAEVRYQYAYWNKWVNPNYENLSMIVDLTDNLSGFQSIKYAYYHQGEEIKQINTWKEITGIIGENKENFGEITRAVWTKDDTSAGLVTAGTLTMALPYDEIPYYIVFEIIDNAGNEVTITTESTKQLICRDNTKPVISDIIYAAPDKWTSADNKLTVKISDTGSGLSKEHVQYSYSYQPDVWYEYQGELAKTGGTVTIELPYYDSSYTVNIRATDFSGDIYKGTQTKTTGNWSEMTTDFAVRKDKTLPTGTITVGEFSPWKSFLEGITFGLFHNDSVKATIEAFDNTSANDGGVVSVKYIKAKKSLTKEEINNYKEGTYEDGTEVELVDCTGDKPDSFTFDLKVNDYYIIYAQITDMAGNVCYIGPDAEDKAGGVVLDNLSPEIEMIYQNEKNTDMWGIWTNQNLSMTVNLKDNLSGFQSVRYAYYYNQNEEINNIENWTEIKVNGKASEEILHADWTLSEETGLVTKGRLVLNLPYDETPYYVIFEVVDNAGQKITTTTAAQGHTINKDNTKPIISDITYAKPNKWTPEDNQLTALITDTGSGLSKEQILYSYSYEADKWYEYTEEIDVFSERITIPLPYHDSSYKVTIRVTDKSGEIYSGEETKDTGNWSEAVTEFTVNKDETLPTATITVGDMGAWDSFVQMITFGLFKNTSKEVKIESNDNTEHNDNGGVKYIEYYVTADILTEADCRALDEKAWTKKESLNTAGDTITFSMDATQQFVVYARITDEAGNVFYVSSNGIVLDKDAALIQFSYAAENTWSNQNLTIGVTVSDAFAGLSEIKTYRDYNGTTTDLTEYFYDSFSSVKTENETKSYTIAAKDLPEGNYTIRVAVVDKAGNTSEKSIRIKKDKTLPTGQITIGDFGTWRNFLNVITFGLFKNSSVPVNISSEDTPASNINETSQVASIEYLRTSEVYTTIQQCESASGWNYINGASTSFTASPDQNIVIYVKIRDNAGNITYICSNGIVLDSAASSADISRPVATVTAKPITNNIYSDSVAVNFMVADPITAGSVTSGLNTVTYKIVNRDTGYETVPVTANVLENVLNKYGQRTGGANKAMLAEASTYGGTINISAEYFNSNHVEIILDAVDNAGNVMPTTTLPLQIDITAPTVNVSYDNNNVGGYEKYFSSARTVHMAVTERNFNASAVRLIITRDGVESVINGDALSWTMAENTAVSNGDGNIYTAQYTFAEDADYTVRMECSDLAGNVCTAFGYEGAAAQDFTIDNIDPTIQTTAQTGYTSEARSVTATIQEHNFEAADAAVLVTKRLNGAVVYTDQVMSAGWSNSGDTHTAVLTFTEDGDYTFVITYKDKAGRNAVSYTSPEFTVDNTNPVLLTNVSAENRNIANKGDIEFVYTYYDINSAMENGMISYRLTTLSGRTVNWEPVIENVSIDGVNGYTLKFSDFAQTAALSDGIYILNVVVKDKAGRSESNTVTFSVNRKGSAYDYEENSYLASVIKTAYVQQIEEDLQVVVVNCDDVTGYQVVIYNSLNEQIVLTPETDYIWELASTDDDGWKKYICTIKKSVFAENGTYNILILTKDNADDSMYGENATFTSNRDAVEGYRTEISFTVDNISPEVVLSGVKDGENYDLDTDIKIDYSDANNIASVEVERLLDDKDIIDSKAYTEAEIASAGEKSGRLVFTATEYNDFQTVQVTVKDIAGNTETQTVRILITSNAWIKFINNTPAVIAVVAGFVAAAAIVIFIIIRKKKKKEAS